MTRSNKRKKTPPKDEFESKHDYMPGFLEALGELADIYENQDDFRKTALRRAIIALDGQIITSVEDIKLFNLIELFGVGKSTLEMLEEFINDGKIEKLFELKNKANLSNSSTYASKAKFLMDLFGDMTEHECEAMYEYWGETGRHTYEPESHSTDPNDSDSDSDASKTNPDQVEWFSNLTKDQADHIQTWWDLEGERGWATVE
jgi:hypothetical protein